MAANHRGHWLLYINGIEVPAQSVSITYGAMAMPEASITLAPDRELLRLGKEDRLQVAVFYLDDMFQEPKDETGSKGPQYRILFEGEIVGWGYENTPMGRSISFRAADYMGIFNQMYMFFVQNVDDLATATYSSEAELWSAAGPTYPAALFYQGLHRPDAGTEYIRRPYDFVENFFRALFGAAEKKDYNSSVAAHFFARWARRTNFINRWLPSPFIEGSDLANTVDGVFPILKALRQEKALTQVINKAQSMSQAASFYQMIVETFRQVYYEFTMIPSMPLVNYDINTGAVMSGSPLVASDPPNVVKAKNDVVVATQALAAAQTNRGTDPGGVSKAQANLAQAKALLAEAQAEAASLARGKGPATSTQPLRIPNYITKPQMQYCVPPTCNLILPSMIRAFQFQEDYHLQPTRFYVNDEQRTEHTGGNNGPVAINHVLSRIGYPERVQSALDEQNNRKLNNKNFLLFPEEYFKGPVFQRNTTPEFFFLLKNRMAGVDEPGNESLTPEQRELLRKQYVDEVRRFEQLYAEMEYFKERGLQRNGGLQLRFNPYLAPGFPTVIFDSKDTGTHLFAYLTSVTHTLSSDAMETSASYTYAQTFEEFFQTLVAQRNGFHDEPTVVSEEVQKAKKAVVTAQAALGALKGVGSSAAIAEAQQVVQQSLKDLALVTDGRVLDSDAVKAAKAAMATAADNLQAAKLGGDPDAIRAAVAELIKAIDALSALKQQNVATAAANAIQAQSAFDEVSSAGDASNIGAATAALSAAQAALSQAELAISQPDMAPAHPIPDLRVRFQNVSNANDYYTAVFQRGQKYSRKAAFDWHEFLGVLNTATDVVDPIHIEEGKTVTTTLANGTQVTQKQVDTNAVQSGIAYWIQKSFEHLAEDSDAAMSYVARPVCTLDEWIDFHGDRAVRDGREQVNPNMPAYYIRILDLIQGPGTEPLEDGSGNPLSQVTADTRDDWETKLLNYRAKVTADVNFKA